MKPHRLDTVSLVFGAVFLLIAGWWLIGRTVDVRLPRLGWLVALGLIVLGAVGLVGAVRGGRRVTATGSPNVTATGSPGWPEEPVD